MANYDHDMMADLAAMDSEFVGVKPAERKGINCVPNGSYQATIDKIYFDRTKDGSKILLKWEMRVATGEYTGTPLYRNSMTTTNENLRWLKSDLLSAGLNMTEMTLTEVAEHLEELLNVMVDVTVKRSGIGDDERVNVYINRRVAAARTAPAAGAA